MELEEIRHALALALKMRSPCFPESKPVREKIAFLEDYMLKSANINGDLVEARHWLKLLAERLADEWEALQGWEVALERSSRSKPTKQDIQAAKRVVNPTLFESGREVRLLRESIDDQIARLEREEKVVSRAYTMMTGA